MALENGAIIFVIVIGIFLFILWFIHWSSAQIKKRWMRAVVRQEMEKAYHCPYCGAVLYQKRNFCPECGRRL